MFEFEEGEGSSVKSRYILCGLVTENSCKIHGLSIGLSIER